MPLFGKEAQSQRHSRDKRDIFPIILGQNVYFSTGVPKNVIGIITVLLLNQCSGDIFGLFCTSADDNDTRGDTTSTPIAVFVYAR
jgi:hypothetical protein